MDQEGGGDVPDGDAQVLWLAEYTVLLEFVHFLRENYLHLLRVRRGVDSVNSWWRAGKVDLVADLSILAVVEARLLLEDVGVVCDQLREGVTLLLCEDTIGIERDILKQVGMSVGSLTWRVSLNLSLSLRQISLRELSIGQEAERKSPRTSPLLMLKGIPALFLSLMTPDSGVLKQKGLNQVDVAPLGWKER